MEVRILFPKNDKDGLEIRVICIDDNKTAKVKEQQFIQPGSTPTVAKEPRWKDENKGVHPWT